MTYGLAKYEREIEMGELFIEAAIEWALKEGRTDLVDDGGDLFDEDELVIEFSAYLEGEAEQAALDRAEQNEDAWLDAAYEDRWIADDY